ncbi:glycoside hydrolase family 3 protein [Ruminococcaceae bacterium OttesenSCG-928-D13]|nr:glycoside hydrolase family 3 protein [Ruminococcaceae bacterium OttesenSCG-928-D13]
MENQKISYVENTGGPRLGYTEDSGAGIIEQDGLYFKNLSRSGRLLPYEDWRLSADERAKDLAARLSREELAGLMLYSVHQMVPHSPGQPFPATYNGKIHAESGLDPAALSDQQQEMVRDSHIRHILMLHAQDAATAAKWSNNLQSLAEGMGHGIPVSVCSDPRHGAAKASAEYKGGGGGTSKWPESVGMAATFSPELCKRFAEIASKECRAMGITTTLSPQVDLATEPRWLRFADTFGEHARLAADMGKAYCDGFQETDGQPDGWGADSVVTMAKHWPGGGTGEGGRDAHYAFGKYNVYPGGNFDEHLIPFTEGVLNLDGKTGKSAAIMPYYSVSWNQGEHRENVGNSYNSDIIRLLRETYGYDDIICTDWMIVGDPEKQINVFGSKCWGMETVSDPERHLRIIMNGVDQIAGTNDPQPLIAAYDIGCERYGEAEMRRRFEAAAARLLRSLFRLGLFENPYVDLDQTAQTVGCEAYVKEGFEAQKKAVVLLKNKEKTLPLRPGIKVYVPGQHTEAHSGFFCDKVPSVDEEAVPDALLRKYFQRVNTPEEADVGLVFVRTPISDAYSDEDAAAGGNGYLPLNLQYRPYTAETARKTSIAGGDPLEASANRGYRGKTAYTANESDLDNVIETKKRMGAKPVVVVAQLTNPVVLAELEPYADGIVADMGVQAQAVLDVITGETEPSGLLPFQLPKDMQSVEEQKEDVPFDMQPYQDELGNVYDFGYGLNWKGKINDARTEAYRRK